jgi:hypothetical protein
LPHERILEESRFAGSTSGMIEKPVTASLAPSCPFFTMLFFRAIDDKRFFDYFVSHLQNAVFEIFPCNISFLKE